MDSLFRWVCEMFDQVSFKSIAAVALAAVGWFIGGFDLPLRALIILYVTDFTLGFCRAWSASSISFNRFRQGTFKFLLYALVVVVAHMLDLTVHGAMPGLHDPVRDFMICFLAVNEFLSVSVHLAALGVRMPCWLLMRVRRYRDTMDQGEVSHDR